MVQGWNEPVLQLRKQGNACTPRTTLVLSDCYVSGAGIRQNMTDEQEKQARARTSEATLYRVLFRSSLVKYSTSVYPNSCRHQGSLGLPARQGLQCPGGPTVRLRVDLVQLPFTGPRGVFTKTNTSRCLSLKVRISLSKLVCRQVLRRPTW
jgi:hypothetical protein